MKTIKYLTLRLMAVAAIASVLAAINRTLVELKQCLLDGIRSSCTLSIVP